MTFIVGRCLQVANHWLPEVLENVDTVLEEIRTEYDGDLHRTVLTGQSMGGHGAWLYASARPHKVKRQHPLVPLCRASA